MFRMLHYDLGLHIHFEAFKQLIEFLDNAHSVLVHSRVSPASLDIQCFGARALA